MNENLRLSFYQKIWRKSFIIGNVYSGIGFCSTSETILKRKTQLFYEHFAAATEPEGQRKVAVLEVFHASLYEKITKEIFWHETINVDKN